MSVQVNEDRVQYLVSFSLEYSEAEVWLQLIYGSTDQFIDCPAAARTAYQSPLLHFHRQLVHDLLMLQGIWVHYLKNTMCSAGRVMEAQAAAVNHGMDEAEVSSHFKDVCEHRSLTGNICDEI